MNEHERKFEGFGQGRRVAVLAFSQFSNDPRVRRETESLVKAGFRVDVICLRTGPAIPQYPESESLCIHRAPFRHVRKGKLRYFMEYGVFLGFALLKMMMLSLRTKYDVVHVHNMPDVLVFCALVPRLRGARIILDLHDPMPEVYRTKYELEENCRLDRILKFFEKISIGFSHLAITPNITFKNIFTSRSCTPEKMRVVVNTPDPEFFQPDDSEAKIPDVQTGALNPYVIMYHGSLVERHGLESAVRAVAALRQDIPELRFDLYGDDTDFLTWILKLVKDLNCDDIIHYHGEKPIDEIPECIRKADLGVIPNLRTPFTEINFPTRIFEYLSQDVPVIAPDTQGIRDYFAKDELVFFNPGEVQDLKERIRWCHQHPDQTNDIMKRGKKVYRAHLWPCEEEVLHGAYKELMDHRKK